MFHLDTNICIYAMKDANPSIIGNFKDHKPANIHISTVVLAELLFGARNSLWPDRNHDNVLAFTNPLGLASFDANASRHYADIRFQLSSAGTPIGPNDLFIAAIARSHGATLVTHNTREFSRVDGLTLADWAVEA